ncbi:MAG: zonular occludens toxin domain-containing protein [Thermoguttaceae bacterium]
MLQIIVGKPGTGKTYHCVSMLVDHVADWCRHELKTGEEFSRKMYTNVRFHEEALDEAVSHRIGKPVEASKYVVFCDDLFFKGSAHWWEQFPHGSLIVLDEVHHHLGADLDGRISERDRLVHFRNWVSTHRHKQQDLWFITQHLENISRDVIRIADTVLEVRNLKQQRLPFPISISMEDVDVVRQAWGFTSQYYVVNTGQFRGRAIQWDSKASTSHLMRNEIFQVYQSHTLSDKAEDRPALALGRIGSLVWFARRHFVHLLIKGLVIWFLLHMFFTVFSAIVSPPKKPAAKSGVVPSQAVSPAGLQAATMPSASVVLPTPSGHVHGAECGHDTAQLEPLPPPAPVVPPDEVIKGVFQNGVITEKGVRYVGDEFQVGGEKRKLVSVDVRVGRIVFGGGYMLRF